MFQPFQNLYQHIKSKDQKLFECLNRISQSLSDLSSASSSNDTTNTTPVFGASGGGHSTGLVPDPGAVAGTTKFLSEDATWKVPTAAAPSPGAWQTPTLLNGWVNNGGGWLTAAYRMEADGVTVRLRGSIKNGTSGTCYTLPPGFRPTGTVFSIGYDSTGSYQLVAVDATSGNVGVAHTNIPVSMDGVTFSTI